MRVPFLGVIVLCATAFVHAATAAPADTFAVRWEPDQPSVLTAPNAGPPAAGDSLPTPPYTENQGPWLSDCTAGATGCGNQDCVSCRLCPCGYAYAESLFMTRTNGNATQPILIDANSLQPVMSTNDLNFNWAPGLRAGAGFRLSDSLYLDFGYLGLYDSHASATFDGSGVRLPGEIGDRSFMFLAANHFQVDYWSQLNSFELNLLCCDCCSSTDPCDGITCGRSLECFGGFRYINLNERLHIAGTGQPFGPNCLAAYDVYTNNNLYGPQLGVRSRFCRGRFGGEVTGKAGIFGNDANEKQAIVGSNPPNEIVYRPTVTGQGTSVAFVGEINLSAIYQLTKTWNVRAGYNLLWINGVALAPNQLDFNANPTISGNLPGSQLNSDGGVFYHGASIGLEARW